MIQDFWNTNHNPITMFGKITDIRFELKNSTFRFLSEDLTDNADYINGKIAVKKLGVSAKVIKSKILENGNKYHCYSSRGTIYYKVKDINEIEIEVIKDNKVPDIYISGKELRDIKGWNSWQLFDKADRNKWIKKRFKGNVTYYLKSEVL